MGAGKGEKIEGARSERPQIGRRNLTPDQVRLIRGRRYNRVKKAAHGREGRQFSGHQNEVPKTSARLAKEHGVSKATIERDAAAVRILDERPDLADQVIQGRRYNRVKGNGPAS